MRISTEYLQALLKAAHADMEYARDNDMPTLYRAMRKVVADYEEQLSRRETD